MAQLLKDENEIHDFQTRFNKINVIIIDQNGQYIERFERLLQIQQDEQLNFGKVQDAQLIKLLKSNSQINWLINQTGCLIKSHPNVIEEQFLQLEPVQIFRELQNIKLNTFNSEQLKLKEAYFQKIKNLLQNPIIMFIVGTPEAPMCRFTKKLVQNLQQYKIKFHFYDIEIDKLMVPYLKEFSNYNTFPQVYIKGKLIGGSDAVQELINKNEFVKLIPEESFMARESKLEQIQLISKFIVLIDGAPDNNYLQKQFSFYNLKIDQEARAELFNCLSNIIESSQELEPYLLYKVTLLLIVQNTVYDFVTLKAEIHANPKFLE
ncbi:hypothetical protein pb186bvf_009368 [Paramecium bursaria]